MSHIAESHLKVAYSPTEAGAMLGYSVVRKAVADRALIPRQLGIRSLIPTDELLAFVRSHPPTPNQPRQSRSKSHD